MFRRCLLFCGCLVAFGPVDGQAEPATQFRGPAGNGTFSESIPSAWKDGADVRWTVDVPGGGWSSPVASNGRIYVTTAVADGDTGPKGFGEGVQSMGDFFRSRAPDKPYSFEVHCLNASDGASLWRKKILSRKPPFKIHPSNSYATESPVTDGKYVYAYFGAVGIVACLDSEGNEQWKRELGAYKTGTDFGTGSSLALHDGKLFVQSDNEEQSFVCALDTETGEDVWRDEREDGTSWSSPIIWKNRSRTELIVCGSGTVTSYDPNTGSVFWKLSGTGGAYSASPTFDEDRLYSGQSDRNSRGPLFAINAGAEGELTLDSLGDRGVAWVEEKSGPGMCSPVVANGHVYVLSRGILTCHDAESGNRVYRERLSDASSVTASLWAAGGKVFSLSESGETLVFRTGDEFKQIGSNSLAGLFWSTPSSTESDLLIRSANQIHCIGPPSALLKAAQ